MKRIIQNATLLNCACFFFCLVLYHFSMAPTVTGEDSGELIAAAYGWGIAHPSGYPLWTLLAGVFIKLIPFGTIAWRANLFSAVLASLSAVLLSRISQRYFAVPRFIAFVGGICFACGNHLWSQAVITEVYTLQILLTCLILYYFLAWHETGKVKYLYWTSLFFGLGLTNHQLTVLLAPVLFVFILIYRPKTFLSPRICLFCLGCLGIGLLPYLYLPLASSHSPYMNWGNPTTWKAFLDHVLRRQYNDNSMHLAHSVGRFWEHIQTLCIWNAEQYTIAAVPFIILGLITQFVYKNMRPLAILTVGVFLMNTVIFGEILNFSFDRQELFCVRVFILPAYIISAIWLLTGCLQITVWCKTIVPSNILNFLSLFPILLITLTSIGINFPKNNMRHYYYALDHANNILNSLEPNAIIFPSGDHNTFPLIYLHYVEKVRPDITIADKYGYIEYSLYQSMTNAPRHVSTRLERDEIEAYIIKTHNRPVYYTVQPRLDFLQDYAVASHGMLFRIYPAGQPKPKLPTPNYHYKNIDTPSIQDHAASVILSDYYFSLAANALRQNNTVTALSYVEKTAQLSDGLKEEMNNLGTLLAEFNQNDQAICFFEKAALLDKTYLTPRWNLANLFKSKGDILHAIQVFNDLALITPEDFKIFGELGFLLHQYGEPELAVKNWGKSLFLNPNQPQILSAIQKSLPTQQYPDSIP